MLCILLVPSLLELSSEELTECPAGRARSSFRAIVLFPSESYAAAGIVWLLVDCLMIVVANFKG
jgi:hypothetical protein